MYRMLFIYAYAVKCHSSAKKITEFKFSSFQENILWKDNRYLLKKKKKDELNNRFFKY